MLDAIYLTLVFTSSDEAVNSLAAEITEISAANKLTLKAQYKTERIFEFIKTLNNFGLPRV